MKIVAGILAIAGVLALGVGARGSEFVVHFAEPIWPFGSPIQSMTKSEATRLWDKPMRFGYAVSGRFYDNNHSAAHYVKGEGARISVSTCRQYAAAISQGYEPENNIENKMAISLVEYCGVFQAVLSAQRPRTSFIENPHVGLGDLNLLPAHVLPPMLWEKAADEKLRDAMSAQDFVHQYKCMVAKADYQLKARCTGLDMVVIEFARADFNGDGTEDILILSRSNAVSGTYYFGGPLQLLSRSSRTARLQMLPLSAVTVK